MCDFSRQQIPTKYDFVPVPCVRYDEPDSESRCKSQPHMSSTDPDKVSSIVYSGPHDLKYYLDRQDIENDTVQENANSHLKRNRVLVFVTYRKKKQTDIPLSDVTVTDKNE